MLHYYHRAGVRLCLCLLCPLAYRPVASRARCYLVGTQDRGEPPDVERSGECCRSGSTSASRGWRHFRQTSRHHRIRRVVHPGPGAVRTMEVGGRILQPRSYHGFRSGSSYKLSKPSRTRRRRSGSVGGCRSSSGGGRWIGATGPERRGSNGNSTQTTWPPATA